MTNRFAFAAAAAALLIAPLAFAGLSAADNASAASSQKAQGDKVKEKKICHSETPTGSIRPVRICRTQAEIDAANQQAQDQLDSMTRARRTG
jgi:hypothetical protein